MRSRREARDDLLAIAYDGPPFADARVVVDPDDGETSEATGRLGTSTRDADAFTVSVAGSPAFEFELRACRGAWLWTRDGADLFVLRIDLGWGCVDLVDA